MRRLFYSIAKGQKCPWCGRKWVWTKARRSLAKLHGQFDLKCKCSKEWTVIVKEDGYGYIEK